MRVFLRGINIVNQSVIFSTLEVNMGGVFIISIKQKLEVNIICLWKERPLNE